MSGLSKPTVEGLIEKLLLDNYIKSDEIESVQNMLQAATKGMGGEEISTLIRTLNDRVDAPSSDLISSNGLNLSGFESAIKETTQIIVKDKITRERNQKENALENLTEEEKLLLEHQKSIEKTKEFFQNSPTMSRLNMSEEDINHIAELMHDSKTQDYIKIRSECENNGMSPEQAHEVAIKRSRF